LPPAARSAGPIAGALFCLALAVLLAFAGPAVATAANHRAELLYRRHCAACHGDSGHGDGIDASLYVEAPRDLREGFLQRYPSSELVRRIRDGRSLRLELDPAALRRRATEVETLTEYMRRLPDIDWSTADAGWEIYIDRCERCHGIYGQPPTLQPPGVHTWRDLSDPAFQRSLDERALSTAVRHGRKGMPALSPRVSKAEAHQLSAFVRLLSPGFKTYTQHCAACHGDSGAGVGSYGEAIHRPAVIFDHSYFARTDADKLRESVWHMVDDHKPSMPHFRWAITEAEAAAIVDYLRGLP
jgi:mono/diheme cytochrome c family protein